MRRKLSALTTRGGGFLAAGVAAVICALVFGQVDLLRIAIFLAVLPLLTLAVVARERYRIAATRTVLPGRVHVGQTATVQLQLENAGRAPTGLLLLEDQVPYALRTRPRFVIDRMSARWRGDLSYTVCSRRRGKFVIGPLTLRVTDPFGFVDLSRSFQTQDALLVTPPVHPLPAARLGGEWAATGESRPRAAAAEGEEDVTVREYRHGDDLRRVHWRSSARRGELMVRREEQPWQNRATLFLDTRNNRHRGHGADSSFEWAISAAASIGVHLLERGYSLRLVTDTGATLTAAAREAAPADYAEGVLLDALAVIEHSHLPTLDVATFGLPGDGSHGLLIAVLGNVTADDAEALVRLKQQATSAFALACDGATWAPDQQQSPHAESQRLAETAAMLRGSGWQVGVARAHQSVPDAWSRLVLGVPATSSVVPTAPRTPGGSSAPAGSTIAGLTPGRPPLDPRLAPAGATPTPATVGPRPTTAGRVTPEPSMGQPTATTGGTHGPEAYTGPGPYSAFRATAPEPPSDGTWT